MIKYYIKTLREKYKLATTIEEKQIIETKLFFARAYGNGAGALDEYRDKLVAKKINAVVDRDAQLAILFNKDSHPDEYEAYQKLRADKKAEADSDMAKMKAELEAALETEVSE